MELLKETRCRGRVERWVELGMMQRVEQVRNIAEMLTAYMEDLSDRQMEIESHLENLNDMTDEIQNAIEELTDLIRQEILDNGKTTNKDENTLPF